MFLSLPILHSFLMKWNKLRKTIENQDILSTDFSNTSSFVKDSEHYANLASLMMLKIQIYNNILSQHEDELSKKKEHGVHRKKKGLKRSKLKQNMLNKDLSISIASYCSNPMIMHVQRLTRIWHRKQQYFYSYFFNIYCKSHFIDFST